VLGELIAAFHRMAVAQALGGRGSTFPVSFAPEVVQLFYQIALLGHRDLALAPDPRCGFEMTLLRMLAFAPDAAGLRVPPAPAPTEGVEPGSAPAAGSKPASTAPADSQASARAAPPVTVLPAEAGWFETVMALKITGVARMLAEHSERLDADPGQYRLRLDPSYDTLLADGPVATLERALGEWLGAPIRLQIEVAATVAETPAARLERERATRQRAAEETLATDHTVQRLLSEFDGRIEGVSPIE
jgi:DNA polymerase-3 subunit gamma/tau